MGVSGCNRRDFHLTEARADHLMRLGVSIFLGPLCTARNASQQNKDSEYKGQFGVGSGYSLSARGPSGRQGVLTKEIGGK